MKKPQLSQKVFKEGITGIPEIFYYGKPVNVRELIYEVNYKAGHKKEAFKLNELSIKTGETERFFTIYWTGYLFELYPSMLKPNPYAGTGVAIEREFIEYKEVVLKVPTITLYALDVFFNETLGLQSPLSKVKEYRVNLNSDAIETYMEMATGLKRRVPKGFWNNLEAEEAEMLIRYFLFFCCGFDRYSAVELKMTHVIRWRLQPLMMGRNREEQSYSLFDMVDISFDNQIKPWEMIFVSKGTYSNEDQRMETIMDIMDIYGVEVIGDLSTTMLAAYAPGVLGYYAKRGGMTGLRKEFSMIAEHAGSGSRITKYKK